MKLEIDYNNKNDSNNIPSEEFIITAIQKYIKNSNYPKNLVLNKLENEIKRKKQIETELNNNIKKFKESFNNTNNNLNSLRQENNKKFSMLKKSIYQL